MDYETWIQIRAEFALLFEELAQGQTVGFPRDYASIYTRPYHEYIAQDGLESGALLMILCMTLSDIVGHQDSYPQIHSQECYAAVTEYRTDNRVLSRLAETVVIALEIINETDFHSRDSHAKYGHVLSMLPWVREHVIIDHFRELISDKHEEIG